MGKIVANVEDESWIDSSIDRNFDFPIEVFPIQIQNIMQIWTKPLNILRNTVKDYTTMNNTIENARK